MNPLVTRPPIVVRIELMIKIFSFVFLGLFLTKFSYALDGSVKDRVTLKEALDEKIMTIAEYDLAICAHYTHAEAIFKYDHSEKPKLVGVARRSSTSDPYKWEESAMASLRCKP